MEGRVKLANGLIKAGNYPAALQVLGQHLGTHPQDQEALYMYGTVQFRSGNFTGAANTFNRLVALWPNDPRAHYSVGITMLKLGSPDVAQEAFQLALRLDPGFTAARQRLAELGSPGGGGGKSPPAGGPANFGEPGVDPLTAKGKLLATGRRAVSSMAGRFLVSGLLGTLGFFVVATKPTAGLKGIAEFFFFLTPGRPAKDLREQLEFMQRSSAPEEQLRGVREELAEAEAALATTVDRMANVLQFTGFVLVLVAAAMIMHGVLQALWTRYQIYEGRLDIREGVLIRRLDSIWLYQVSGVHYEQPLWLALVGKARLRLVTDKLTKRGQQVTRSITGITGLEPPVTEGSVEFTEKLFHELRDNALEKGLSIKKFWVQ